MFRRLSIITALSLIPVTSLAQTGQELTPQSNPVTSDPKTLEVLQPANPTSSLQGTPPQTEAVDPQKLGPNQALRLLQDDIEPKRSENGPGHLNRPIGLAGIALIGLLVALAYLNRRYLAQQASAALGRRLPFQRSRRNS